jgi:predicted ATPase
MDFEITSEYRKLKPVKLLDLPQQTILVGENGCGKTSLISLMLEEKFYAEQLDNLYNKK